MRDGSNSQCFSLALLYFEHLLLLPLLLPLLLRSAVIVGCAAYMPAASTATAAGDSQQQMLDARHARRYLPLLQAIQSSAASSRFTHLTDQYGVLRGLSIALLLIRRSTEHKVLYFTVLVLMRLNTEYIILQIRLSTVRSQCHAIVFIRFHLDKCYDYYCAWMSV